MLLAARAAGPLALGPLVHLAVLQAGAPATLRGFAAAFVVLLAPVFLLLRASRVDAVLAADRRDGGGAGGAKGGVPTGALRPHFWTLLKAGGVLGFGTVPGMILFGHAAAIVAGRGGSTALVATCVSWMAVSACGRRAGRGGGLTDKKLTNLLGRLVGGAVIDRLSSRAALGGIPLFSIVGMLGLIATDSPAAAVAMLLATMTHFGLLTTTMPVALTRQVGPPLFAKAYGTIFFFWGLAGLVAPWAAGLLYDLSGGYRGAYLFGLGASVLAMLSGLAMPPDPEREMKNKNA